MLGLQLKNISTIRTREEQQRQSITVLLFLILLFALLGPLLTAPPEGATTASTAASLSGDGNFLRQSIFLGLFVALLWTIRIDTDLRRVAVIPTGLVIALACCWVSLSWSIAPDIGLRRLGLTTLTVVSISVAVDAVGVVRSMRALRYALGLMLVLSLLAVVLVPRFGVHQVLEGVAGDPAIPGMWRGIYPEKNVAGSGTAVTILVFLLSPETLPKRVRITASVMALVFLVGTGSKTSLALVVIALGASIVYRLYDPRFWPIVFGLIGISVLVAIPFIQYQWNDILQPFNREDTLTGRVQIWPVLWAYLSDHWWLGSGYGSFWNIGPHSPIFQYSRSGSWVSLIASGHNGYLDLAVQIGVPGLIICAVALIFAPIARLMTRPEGGVAVCSLIFALLIFSAGHNLTESTLLDRDMFPQVCIVLALATQRVCRREKESGTVGG